MSVPGTHVDIRHKLAVWEIFALIPAVTLTHDNSEIQVRQVAAREQQTQLVEEKKVSFSF